MTKWMLAASAAALAMTAPAFADKGGHGHGNGGGGSHANVSRGGGGGHANVNRGGGHASANRGGGGAKMHVQSHGGGKPQVQRQAHNDRRPDHAVRVVDHGNRGNHGVVKSANRGFDTKRNGPDFREVRLNRDDNHVRFAPRWDDRGVVRYEGCPPGLAKKGNGCMPPGLAKKVVGTTLSADLASRVLSGPYRDWYRDDDRYFYRWDNDYIYRVNRQGGLIDALFPYANNDYTYYPLGYQYPSSYNYYNVPYQYRSYYPDGGDTWYRYGNGAIYSVNPSNGLISGIAALLAGDLSVGQPLPPAYSVYNMPLSYRDQYYDTPDTWYRYNDGYIYRVDPTTQLVTAVINAIV